MADVSNIKISIGDKSLITRAYSCGVFHGRIYECKNVAEILSCPRKPGRLHRRRSRDCLRKKKSERSFHLRELPNRFSVRKPQIVLKLTERGKKRIGTLDPKYSATLAAKIANMRVWRVKCVREDRIARERVATGLHNRLSSSFLHPLFRVTRCTFHAMYTWHTRYLHLNLYEAIRSNAVCSRCIQARNAWTRILRIVARMPHPLNAQFSINN